jgi:hypothetical protein
MQIHELTLKTKTQVDEGIADTLGAAAGKAVSGVKNVGSAVAAPFKDVAGGYKAGRQDQKVNAMADKAYRAWKGYEAQLLKADPKARESGQLEQQLLAFVNKNLLGGMYLPNVINKDKIISLVKQIGGANPGATKTAPTTQPPATQQPPAKAHTGGKVAGQLSQTPGAIAKRDARAKAKQTPTPNVGGAGAFGQMANQLTGNTPNTMANAPISKVNVAKTPLAQQGKTAGKGGAVALNKASNNLAATQQPQVKPKFGQAPTAVKGAARAGAPTPAEYEKLQQKIAAASKKPTMNEVSPTIKPITRPVGSLASRSKLRNAPATQAAKPAPAQQAPVPAQQAPAPAQQAPVPAQQAPAPAQQAPANPNEKELFKQLVQQSALAQTSAPGAGSGSASRQGQTGNAPGDVEDARGMADTLRQQLDPAIAKGLPALGTTASKLTGSRQVKSTGNPAADGLLTLMGFQGL